MNIIVIGASGFLGKAVKNFYTSVDATVTALSFRPDKKLLFLEEATHALTSLQPSAVINTAASQSSHDSVQALSELIDSNIFLPATMASLIKQFSQHTALVNFGSSWQIGENGEKEPLNAYAASKTAAEAFLDHFALDNLRTATIRLYDTYGPCDSRNKVVNLIAKAIAAGTTLEMSSGEQCIDLVYIDDVVAAIAMTVDRLVSHEGGIHLRLSVRSGKTRTVREVLNEFKTVSSAPDDLFRLGVYPYRKRERFSLHPGGTLPEGWLPLTPLKTGFKKVLDSINSGNRDNC